MKYTSTSRNLTIFFSIIMRFFSLQISLQIIVLSVFFCLCFSGLSSCVSNVSNVDLPYTEKIVINGLLIAGEPVQNIQISRTLPPLATFNYDAIFVGDAKVTLTFDRRTVELRLRQPTRGDTLPNGQPAGRRSFYEAPDVKVEAGKNYTLRVEWQGKVAEAETTVPAEPNVVSQELRFGTTSTIVTIGTAIALGAVQPTVEDTSTTRSGPPRLFSVRVTEAVITVRLRQQGSEMSRIATARYFDATQMRRDSVGGNLGLGLNGIQTAQRAVEGIVTLVQRTNIFRLTPTAANNVYSMVTVQTADSAYYEYAETLARAQQSGNSFFGSEGLNPRWNVKGDGIGLFVGTAQKILRLERR